MSTFTYDIFYIQGNNKHSLKKINNTRCLKCQSNDLRQLHSDYLNNTNPLYFNLLL